MSLPSCHSLVTARLLLRPITVHDADDLHALWTESAFVAATGLSPALSLQDVRHAAGVYAALNQLGVYRKWVILARSGEGFLGECEVFPNKPQWQPWTEWTLGYSLRGLAWGHGYMREAGRALLASVFEAEQTCRVRADVLPGNLRSRRLLGALGFRYEGLQRGRTVSPQGPCDEELWGLTRADWLAREARQQDSGGGD